jgi:non-specific serine/threonine protein kinase
VLTPQGHLRLVADNESPALHPDVAERLAAAFERGAGHGLLALGGREAGALLPPVFAYWRDFAARYITELCATAADASSAVAPLDVVTIESLIVDAPPMRGTEYLTASTLIALWEELHIAFQEVRAESKLDLQALLKRWNPAWNLVGRVHFNLAENRKDASMPFAFLATYTAGLSAQGKVRHQPLSAALTEFAGARKKVQLLSLLLPVQRAAEECPWLRAMVDTGEIYQPLRWSADEALRLLHDVPKLEMSGIVLRMPGNWQAGRPPRPRVTAIVGASKPSTLGMEALLDLRKAVTHEGDPLTPPEIEQLLSGVEGLRLIRGRWVEVDAKRLRRVLSRFETIQQASMHSGVPFAEAMRLASGATVDEMAEAADAEWSGVIAGDWLADTLR